MNNNNSIFMEIIKDGIYYNPAYKHYGDNLISVMCDKCNRMNLTECYGHKEKSYDLCLECYNDINKIKSNIKIFVEIINDGIYYNPACKHYNNDQISVTCDKCYRKNLIECYGHKEKEYDLCLECYNDISNTLYNQINPIKTPDLNYQSDDKYLTTMMQFLYH